LLGAAFFITKASLTGVADATLACKIIATANTVAATDIDIVFEIFYSSTSILFLI
jgi:hypothetical protein